MKIEIDVNGRQLRQLAALDLKDFKQRVLDRLKTDDYGSVKEIQHDSDLYRAISLVLEFGYGEH